MRNLMTVLSFTALILAVPLTAEESPVGSGGHLLRPTTVANTTWQALDAVLHHFDVAEVNTRAIDRRIRRHGRLRLEAAGEAFDLRLVPNELRSPDYQAFLVAGSEIVELERAPVVTFKGHVAGDPGSSVRLTITESYFSATVRTASGTLHFEPLAGFVRGAGDGRVVIYHERDVRARLDGSCGVDHAAVSTKIVSMCDLDPLTLGPAKALPTPPLKIATDADGEFTQRYGESGALLRSLDLLNDAEDIYQSAFGLSFDITFQIFRTNPATDPYTATNAESRMNQLKFHWNQNFGWVDRRLTHLFAGNALDGADGWGDIISTPCSRSYAVSSAIERATGNVYPDSMRVKTLAHEFGHNMGAYHDDDEKHSCASVTCSASSRPLMCSQVINNATTFSSCSSCRINDYIDDLDICN